MLSLASRALSSSSRACASSSARRAFSSTSSSASSSAARVYTKSHEWIAVENGVGTVGITDYAQDKLGDIVFIGLPAVGKKLQSNRTHSSERTRRAACAPRPRPKKPRR